MKVLALISTIILIVEHLLINWFGTSEWIVILISSIALGLFILIDVAVAASKHIKFKINDNKDGEYFLIIVTFTVILTMIFSAFGHTDLLTIFINAVTFINAGTFIFGYLDKNCNLTIVKKIKEVKEVDKSNWITFRVYYVVKDEIIYLVTENVYDGCDIYTTYCDNYPSDQVSTIICVDGKPHDKLRGIIRNVKDADGKFNIERDPNCGRFRDVITLEGSVKDITLTLSALDLTYQSKDE